MARERERYVKRTGGQPCAGDPAPVAFLDTALANMSKEFRPALITLVKLFARQAAREEMAINLGKRFRPIQSNLRPYP